MQIQIAVNGTSFLTEMSPQQWDEIVKLLAPTVRPMTTSLQVAAVGYNDNPSRSDASVKASAVVPTQQRSHDASARLERASKLLEEIGLTDTLLSDASASEQDILREHHEQCFAELDKLNREACGAQTTDATTMLVPWRLLRRCEYLVELLLDRSSRGVNLPAVSSETLVAMRDELRKVQGKTVTVQGKEATLSEMPVAVTTCVMYGEPTAKAFDVDALRDKMTAATGVTLERAETGKVATTAHGSLETPERVSSAQLDLADHNRGNELVREQPIDTRYKAPEAPIRRCSLCGCVRNDDGVCSFVECKDPLHDNRVERESAVGKDVAVL